MSISSKERVLTTFASRAADRVPVNYSANPDIDRRLAFHGCISTAGPVAYGTVDEVVKYCRQTLAVMMPGGGYCFAPTHELQDNSPTQNVVAMYEVARTDGHY